MLLYSTVYIAGMPIQSNRQDSRFLIAIFSIDWIVDWIVLYFVDWIADWIVIYFVDWIGLDWIGLDWIGLDWIGLDWIGLDWIGNPAKKEI